MDYWLVIKILGILVDLISFSSAEFNGIRYPMQKDYRAANATDWDSLYYGLQILFHDHPGQIPKFAWMAFHTGASRLECNPTATIPLNVATVLKIEAFGQTVRISYNKNEVASAVLPGIRLSGYASVNTGYYYGVASNALFGKLNFA